MFDLATLQNELIRDEGLKLKPYRDTVGKLTVGCGRNLDDVGITETEAKYLMANDIVSVCAGLDRALPWWRAIADARQRALVNIAFNVGVHGLLGYRKMLEAMQAGDFKTAAAECLDSDAARDLPNRYHRIANLIEEG
jgi:lysozyme